MSSEYYKLGSLDNVKLKCYTAFPALE